MTGWFFAAALGLIGLSAVRSGASKPSTVGPITKMVTVDGRVYLVNRLGGGIYQVVRRDRPDVFLLLDQHGILSRGGDAAASAELDRDMNRFPADLFK